MLSRTRLSAESDQRGGYSMRRIGLILAIAVAVTIAAAAPAGAATSLVTVSGPSPYAGCSDIGQPGTIYVNAEVEPSVAVNPATVGTKHVNVIGTWQQDRWSNGGARGL